MLFFLNSYKNVMYNVGKLDNYGYLEAEICTSLKKKLNVQEII